MGFISRRILLPGNICLVMSNMQRGRMSFLTTLRILANIIRAVQRRKMALRIFLRDGIPPSLLCRRKRLPSMAGGREPENIRSAMSGPGYLRMRQCSLRLEEHIRRVTGSIWTGNIRRAPMSQKVVKRTVFPAGVPNGMAGMVIAAFVCRPGM